MTIQARRSFAKSCGARVFAASPLARWRENEIAL
jgi:hypothetical protein